MAAEESRAERKLPNKVSLPIDVPHEHPIIMKSSQVQNRVRQLRELLNGSVKEHKHSMKQHGDGGDGGDNGLGITRRHKAASLVSRFSATY